MKIIIDRNQIVGGRRETCTITNFGIEALHPKSRQPIKCLVNQCKARVYLYSDKLQFEITKKFH